MDSSANCNLCGNCIKACPNDAITLTVRTPTKELWFLGNPKIEESFLAMAIMGIVVIQNVTKLPVWTTVLDSVNRATGITSYPVIFTAVFAVQELRQVRVRADPARRRRARRAQPLPPARRGQVGVYTVGGLFGGQANGSPALVGNGKIQMMQFALLALGLVGSFYTVRRIAHRRYLTPARRRSTLIPSRS
jgi:ferredoxin